MPSLHEAFALSATTPLLKLTSLVKPNALMPAFLWAEGGKPPSEGKPVSESPSKSSESKGAPTGDAPSSAGKPSEQPTPPAGGASKPSTGGAPDVPGLRLSSTTGSDKKNKESGEDDEDDDPMPRVTASALKLVGCVVVVAGCLYFVSLPLGNHVSWEELNQRANEITHIAMYEQYLQVYFKEGRPVHVGITPHDQRTHDKLSELMRRRSDEEPKVTLNYIGVGYAETGLRVIGILAWTVPFLFFPTFAMVLMRGMSSIVSTVQSAGMDRTGSKLKDKPFVITRTTSTRFKDVAGLHEAKHEIKEVVDFLRNPEPFKKLGAKIPNGALLLGPPGTGKTLLAKAVAGEADVSFIATTGSDFVELYVGMGALRVRQLFQMARQENQKGRTCIIYIDEIDAVGLKRRGAGHGEKQEQEHTLNELLTQLDGFKDNEGRILVLASSNVQQDQLDPALIRPGRIDRIVHVDSPVIAERIEIFHTHLDKLKLMPDLVEPEGDGVPQGDDVKAKAAGDVASPTTKATTAESTEPSAAVKPEEKQSSSEEKPSTKTLETAAADTQETKATEKTLNAKPSSTDTAKATETDAKSDTAVSTAEPETSSALQTQRQEGDAPQEDDGKSPARRVYERERKALIEQYAQRMSDLCPGFVGADISNVCNEAAILAARENKEIVDISHLERSIDRVLAGIEMRSRVLSDFEKKVVAHHEAGHAIAGWYLNRADPLMKVSIVPRGGKALGYAQYLPNENNLRTSKDILDSICVTLGGRVAEKIFFDHLSTGASDDLMKVTRMSYHYATSFAESGVAHIPPGVHSTPYSKPYGNRLSDKFDNAARAIVDQAYQRTYDLLLSRKKEMQMLADHLLKHEVLTHQDVVNYLGPRDKRATDFRIV